MGSLSKVLDGHTSNRQDGAVDDISRSRMRHHAGVQSVERALVDHVDFASGGLLGWGSEQFDASNEVVLLESDLGTQGRGQSNYSRETNTGKVNFHARNKRKKIEKKIEKKIMKKS